MFNFNGPAMLATMIALGGILAFSLIFSFRDTCRGFHDFFDPRVFRQLVRSIFGHPPQFSLRSLFLLQLLVPLLILVIRPMLGPDFPLVIILGGYALIVVFPLIYWFFVEAFGPGPRERWRKVLDRRRKISRGGRGRTASSRPEPDCSDPPGKD
jgi:hypothetical protein